VYIESTPEQIEAIIAAILNDSDKHLLNHLRPEPVFQTEEEENTTLMPNWWSWRVGNWGTKWEVDAEIVSHNVSGGWINLAFDSACSPPIEALAHWESQDPENRSYNIRYIEWGMMFCGEADSDGYNQHFSIPQTVAEVQAIIPVEIDEEFGISDSIAQWADSEWAEEEETTEA
jgi:hypothetical protein